MSTLPTTLEFLLVSEDFTTINAVSEAAEVFGANLGFAHTAEVAHQYLQRRKVDAVFVDTDVPGTRNLVMSVRQGMSNRMAVVLACVPSPTASPVALVIGATYLLHKPLTLESVVANLNAAREIMARERRRYFRMPVKLPVSLGAGEGAEQVMMTNLSEGGMAIHTPKPMRHRSLVEFTFDLSSSETISGKGLISWANNEGLMGLQFQYLRGDGATRLEKWLAARMEVPCRIDVHPKPRPPDGPSEC